MITSTGKVAKQSQSPAHTPIPFPVSASIDPNTLQSPSADLVEELTENREAHEGAKEFTLCSFPSHLRTFLDRLRTEIEKLYPTRSKPSLNATIDCCIIHGLSELQAGDEIAALIKLKSKLDYSSDLGMVQEVEAVKAWFWQFPHGIPNSIQSPMRRVNLQITEGTKKILCALASELGFSASSLAQIAIISVLSGQSFLPQDRIVLLQRDIATFLGKIRLHVQIGEIILGEMEKVWKARAAK